MPATENEKVTAEQLLTWEPWISFERKYPERVWVRPNTLTCEGWVRGTTVPDPAKGGQRWRLFRTDHMRRYSDLLWYECIQYSQWLDSIDDEVKRRVTTLKKKGEKWTHHRSNVSSKLSEA